MTLSELIAALEKAEPGVLREGFGNPHSYRGYYECVAFEPQARVTVQSCLDAAREALGSRYEGYKGGEFKMKEYTDVYIAHYGCCGDEIGDRLLRYMLADRMDQP